MDIKTKFYEELMAKNAVFLTVDEYNIIVLWTYMVK